MENQKKINYVTLPLTAIIVILFFLGFYNNENSAGAGNLQGDFGHIWHNLGLFKNEIISSLNNEAYSDSRTPLAYILHVLFNPFIDNEFQFRVSVFIISLFAPILFFFCLKINFVNINNKILILISSLILLSPYFRTSAYWGLGENYGLICLLASYLFLQKALSKDIDKSVTINNIVIFCLCLFSSLCVYFDQKLLFVPLLCFIMFLNSNKSLASKVKLILYYSFFAIPMIYLVIIWGNILPPFAASARKVGGSINIYNIGYCATIIAFYMAPILVFFKKENFFKIVKDFFSKKNLHLILFPFLVYLIILVLFDDFSQLPDLGKGLAHKIILISFNNIYTKMFFTFFAFGISWIIITMYLKEISDKLVIFYLFLLSLFTFTIFQEYFDPLILILLLTFFKTKIYPNFKNVLALTLYLGVFLLSSNVYYKTIL